MKIFGAVACAVFLSVGLAACNPSGSAEKPSARVAPMEGVEAYPSFTGDPGVQWRAHIPDFTEELRLYYDYEIERIRVRDEGTSEQYSSYLSVLPNDDVIIGRTSQIMDYILDFDKYPEVPIDGRGRLYTSYWGATGRAAVALYEVDGNRKALEFAIACSDIILSRQNDFFGRKSDTNGKIEAGWLAYHEGVYFNETMANGMIVMPMINLLKLAQTDPWVRARIGEERYAHWINEIRDTLVQFDDVKREEQGLAYYVEPFLNAGETEHWVEAWNHMSIYGAALIEFYALTKEENVKRRAKEMVEFYKAIVETHDNGTVSWSYMPRPGDMTGLGEDVWKGAVSIETPLAAYAHDFGIDYEHMVSLNHIIGKNIFLEGGRVDRSLSPGFYVDLNEMPSSLVSMMASWYRLSCFDESMVPLISDYFASRPDVMPGGYLNESRVAIYGLVELKRYEKFGCPAARKRR